jgi:hypothetical protein
VEAGGGSAAVVTGATAAGFSLGLAVTVLGPALRAIGRGFGNGTLALAHASVVSPENPTASAKLVAITNASNSGMAFDRNAGVRGRAVTEVLRSESIHRVRI